MYNPWLVIIPPLIVLLLSFLTHRVTLSLFLGIASAALIFHDFSLIPSIKTMWFRFIDTIEINSVLSWQTFVQNTSLFIYLFLFMLGILIIIIGKTGGTTAYRTFVQKKLKTKISAELSSLLLTLMFFIDEYLNILTVGSVMHPVTDKFKIPRAKLAFIINAVAASLCVIVPISSWCAFILAQLNNSGVLSSKTSETLILASPMSFFAGAIPFSFYSIIIIIATFFIVKKGISFGPMHKHETIAEKTGNLYAGKKEKVTPAPEVTNKNNSLIDFLLPIVVLVTIVIGSILLLQLNAPAALCLGSTVSLITSIIFFVLRKKLLVKNLFGYCVEGIKLMWQSIVVITLAWVFSKILTADLATGDFLASKLTGIISLQLLPLIFFVATTLVTLAIVSAWGSIALMIPIAIPMIISFSNVAAPVDLYTVKIALPTLAAILGGAVAGIQLSPIADITIIASTSTGAHHMDYIKTQQYYVIPIFVATCVSFLISGLLIHLPIYINTLISLSTGLTIAITTLTILNKNK